MLKGHAPMPIITSRSRGRLYTTDRDARMMEMRMRGWYEETCEDADGGSGGRAVITDGRSRTARCVDHVMAWNYLLGIAGKRKRA